MTTNDGSSTKHTDITNTTGLTQTGTNVRPSTNTFKTKTTNNETKTTNNETRTTNIKTKTERNIETKTEPTTETSTDRNATTKTKHDTKATQSYNNDGLRSAHHDEGGAGSALGYVRQCLRTQHHAYVVRHGRGYADRPHRPHGGRRPRNMQ